MTDYKQEANVLAMVIVAVTFFIIMVILHGCGSVTVEKHSDCSYKASSMSFFKDIKDVSIQKDEEGNVTASMGTSVTNQNAESALMLVCVINPSLPMCQLDQ